MKYLIIRILSRIAQLLDNAYHKNLYNNYRQKYSIHKSFIFNGENILMYGDGEIIIGKNSYIGRYSILQSSIGNKIYIGENCKIGPRLSIWTQTTIVDYNYNMPEIPPKTGNIIIKDGVWIGVNVYIAPGVIVGENSIIGANSVVTRNVPKNAIVGGIPAKLIRYKKLPNDFDKYRELVIK